MNDLLNEVRTVLKQTVKIEHISYNIENDQIPKKSKALSLDCSIMFVDMRGSTELADENSKKNMIRIYKALARIVIHCVQECDGDVKQIVGDGFLCLFTNEKSAKNAYECAEKINKNITDILNLQICNFSKIISVGFGICTGNVLLSKIGRKGKGKVAVPVFAGSTTNYASKYCEHAVGEEIIICENTYKQLSKRDKESFKPQNISINGNQLNVVYSKKETK